MAAAMPSGARIAPLSTGLPSGWTFRLRVDCYSPQDWKAKRTWYGTAFHIVTGPAAPEPDPFAVAEWWAEAKGLPCTCPEGERYDHEDACPWAAIYAEAA